jgi:non-specific serine/threonine protein kinase/serine/threonine-protein kinase
MRKKPIFSLDPDQLERLFSLGTGDPDPTDEHEQHAGNNKPEMDREDAAKEKEYVPGEKEPSVNATASLVGMERPGNQIGRYKLLSILGEGGMGMVYLAEQEGQLRRKVALKIIKPGMDSKRVIARFETERQALALLDHPGIAQVYDAGTTEQGRPYFVMEHVRGLPITDYCDRHKLTVEDRLRLFQQVCLAVHHAHQKGIIHRDIKPSNILVSAENDRPIPKIIDFGVAKAISQPLTERTLFTEDSHLLGTPEYMSPEQADMSNEDIDTRSDIYSLGVLLYVLLAGILPYDSKTFRQGGVEHIRRIIRETDPKTPSTRLAKLGAEATKLAEKRRTEIHTLTKHLKKELEWIPLKAMRKDRAERYRSSSELSDDIENYLNGEPLIAGPPGTGYKLKKFVRRNCMLVSGMAAVLLVLIVGVVVSTILAIGQSHARNKAQLVTNFLRSNVLGSASTIKGREATVIDVLNAAVAKLDEGLFRDRPLIEARIRETLAWTYYDLGRYAVAAQHQKHVHRIYLEQFGENHVQTNSALNMIAVYYYHAGRYREAEPLYRQVIEKASMAGIPVEKRLNWNANLGTTCAGLGRYEEAEQLVRPKVDADPWIGYGLHLGEIYREQGKYQEAERVLLDSLDAGHKVNEENKNVQHYGGIVRCIHELGLLRLTQSRYKEAEDWFEQGMDLGITELPGKDHPYMLRHVNGLAIIRIKQQQYQEAKTLLERALEGRKLKLGEDHPNTIRTIHYFGILYREQGQFDNAEQFLIEAHKKRRSILDEDHPHTLQTMHELAILYKEQERYEEAEELLNKVIKGRRLKIGDTHPHTIESIKNLIALYEAWNKPEKADQWRTKMSFE